MKKLIGVALLVIGALPPLATSLVWISHMRTIGLSSNAEIVFAGLLVADIVCLAVGTYLITQAR